MPRSAACGLNMESVARKHDQRLNHRPMKKLSKAKQRERRAQDRLFGRQMKLATDPDVELSNNEEVKKFVRKYRNSMSARVKQDMRNMWRLANCDFELAASILVAREYAWKEKVTEGEWMSEEMLHDHLKSKTNTANYMKSCKAQGLVKQDTMQKCKVYFFMKKLERMGKREEAGRAEEWHGRKKGKKALQEQCGGNNSVLKRIKDVASESVESKSDSEQESTEGSHSCEGSSDKSSENEGEHHKY